MSMDGVKSALMDILPLIEKSAPAIASAIGTPSTGVVVSLLCDLFGANKNDLTDLVNKVISDPSADKKLVSVQDTFFNNVKGWLSSKPSKAVISLCLEWGDS